MSYLLHHQKCEEGLLTLSDVDVVVTSPPYNLGIKYNTYKDERDDYLEWSETWIRAVHSALAEDGHFFLNLGSSPKRPGQVYHLISRILNLDLFTLQNTFHWVKSITLDQPEGSEVVQRGHFKPINSKRFVNDCHEFVYHFTKTGKVSVDRKAIGVPYADKSNVSRWGHSDGEDLRCRGNIWFIPYKTIQSRNSERPHPATFPPQLAVNCIKLAGNPGHVVDPFNGLGNTGIAARMCGVSSYTGFDIDRDYLELSAGRIPGDLIIRHDPLQVL